MNQEVKQIKTIKQNDIYEDEEGEQFDYFDLGTNVPTLRQFKTDFIETIEDFQKTLKDLDVPQLDPMDDLDTIKITLNKVLEQIPPEERLNEIGFLALRHRVDEKIKKYKGGYKVLERVKQNMSNLKREQQRVYYVATELNLPPISPEYKELQPTNLFGLSSFKQVYINKKNRIKFPQKNMISKDYAKTLTQIQMANNIDILGGEVDPNFLKKYDILINVAINDSQNCEKQVQYLCLETNTLWEVIQKYQCVIEELSKTKYKDKNNDDKKCQFIIVGDHIFYKGNVSELDKFFQRAVSFEKVHFRIFDMDEVKLGQIRAIFGHPYLYRHLGGCDHLIYFKQARLFTKNDEYHYDVGEKKVYPYQVFESKMRRKKCDGCQLYFSDIISIGDPLKNGENTFLCNQCHESLHFDQNGNPKGGTIKLIPYIHD